MKSATLTHGAGPGSTITLTPETLKVRDAIIAKFADKSLAELNDFIDTALSTEGDDNKRLGILAARVFILRMRLQNISSFNRDASKDILNEITPANLTDNTNTLPQGSGQNTADGEDSDETYQEWNELTTTESGEINGVRIPKGVTVTTNLCTVRQWRQLRRWISGNFSTVPFLFQNGPNFMAYFRGVLFHLSWVIIHHIKPTTYGYYHIKWF